MSLQTEVTETIDKLAEQAAQRTYARELLAGAPEEHAEQRAAQRRQEVREQLSKRFQETGELPSDIAPDLVAILGGPKPDRLAPPVITITNCNLNLGGSLRIDGLTVEARESIARTKSLSWGDRPKPA